MSGEEVLVTGGSGFLAAHCIVQLLEAGYRVRTTVRSPNRAAEVRALVTAGGAEASDRLSIVIADLSATDGWAEAVAGCSFVLHVASPNPATEPDSPNTVVAPARDGTIRVLRAARDAQVKRVVLTSSFGAIGYGGGGAAGAGRPADRLYDETDWSTTNGEAGVVIWSKTLAERAAWQFMREQGGDDLELAVVNPVAVFGPVLGPRLSTSVALVAQLLNGTLSPLPHASLSAVDVRDVAELHVRAMTHPDASGQRFIASTGSPLTYLQIAQLLKSRLGDDAQRVPTRQLPDWMAWIVSPFTPAIGAILPQLGPPKIVSNAKAKRVLGWAPRTNIEAIVSCAESLLELGVVRRSR